jgi:hypothetical protein
MLASCSSIVLYTKHDSILTCFALAKRDMPPGLVLDKLDLDLASARLLVLGLAVVIVVVPAVAGLGVLDEAVLDGRDRLAGAGTLARGRRGVRSGRVHE